MNVMKLLEYLQDILDTSHKIPLTGKVTVSRKEISKIINQIINDLPDELKKAQWILDEKERIISEAMKEAEIVKEQSIERVKREIQTHDITRTAQVRAEEIISSAQREADEIISSAQRDSKEIRIGARDYADEILCDLEKQIQSKMVAILENLKLNVEHFASEMQDEAATTVETIRENIKELRKIK
ncbi:MAG: ATPase [Bacillota bacterium]|nr:ATPase [Bacillota bacterium]